MRQLVGLSCVLCGERIGTIIDGQFCGSCGCPVHTKCARPAPPTNGALCCAACGAAAEHRQHEQALHQQHEGRRSDPTGGRNSRIWVAGIVGFAIMGVSAFNSTVDPRPDGRLLNTASAIGFDIFLPIALLGIGFCLFRLVRGRQ